MANKPVSTSKPKTHKPRKSNKSKQPKLTGNMKKAVDLEIKKMIKKNEETKYSALNYKALDADTSSLSLLSAMPQVQRGVGDNQRVGNKIEVVKSELEIIMSLKSDYITNPSNACADITAVVFVWKSKQVKDFPEAQLSSGAIARLRFNDGQGGEVDWDGTPLTAMFPVFSERYTLLARKEYKLAHNGNLNALLIGTPNMLSRPTNEHVKLDLTKHCKKHLLFDDSSDPVYAVNEAIFFTVAYFHADGSTADYITNDLEFNAVAKLYYKDA